MCSPVTSSSRSCTTTAHSKLYQLAAGNTVLHALTKPGERGLGPQGNGEAQLSFTSVSMQTLTQLQRLHLNPSEGKFKVLQVTLSL